jgi:Fe(3+) dicitrate transport protein
MGPLEFRLDAGYVRADGQRDNSQYNLWQTDLYLGYRPDEHQLFALDFYSSRFDGGDPGRITYKQWVNDPNFSFTPFNNDWVDQYTTVLRYERDFGSGWLMQVKGWFTHQEIDARTAANNVPGAPHPFPSSTTFGYETFNNCGADLRFRKLWGDDTIFKGSAVTFGGVVYHGDAPFIRYTLNEENSEAGLPDRVPRLDFRHHPSRSIADRELPGILYRRPDSSWKISHGRLVPP